ncbi:helix-turn-helix DNA-binding domain protein [Mycobacterium phage Typha]|uniref:Helix-turn-helix DNA-binding domain protein n=1 Tax=Mycobacterium phage Typha TaxID=2517971 RepID=A0A482J6U0_9CAUD|nr:helix-turn-helix DNA-binding domain protein [Mycobacterium phage Typha]QBP29727.1 helix-turn-helix DNA-binding domain protein [Mycobacterium phage Typha]URM86513.1 helix-turn-helix DNA-binding domain protein [Mycobacterium phage Hilltopfarm]
MTGDQIVDALAQARVERGWSQSRMAKQLHVWQSGLSMIETGQRRPTLDTVVSYADALGYDLVLVPRR